MEMERIERAYELLSVTEKNHTQTIRNAYRKVIKINKKNETLTPELSSEAKAAMYLLIERRKRMKSEVVIQRDAQLHDEIRVRMNAKKFFAPRLWFKIALPIIIWAILQEIIMASTDIVDNIFVNWMKDDQIQGLAQLQDDIKTFWGNVTIADLDAAGLSHEYLNLTYHAGQIAVNGVTASNQLYTIMYCVVSGACYGIGVYSAQFYGAGNKERLRNVTALKFYFTLSVAGLFAMIAIPGITEPLIKFTTNPGAAIARPGVNADILTRFHYIQHEAAVLATNEGIKYFRTIFW
jgi:Na+-driven multidrug efflux pump